MKVKHITTFKYFFIFFLVLFYLPSTQAHSFMLVPKADFSHFTKPECRLGGPSHSPNDTCDGPCIPKNSWQHNQAPSSTTYERGQNISVVWTKNNHRGGFIRLSLVPKALRMNHSAHKKFAFRYACFDSDPHKCQYDTSVRPICGTQPILLRTQVKIPYSFPDGDYVLGWAWFGGLHWHGFHSYFGDYWSCADVRITGGPFRESHTPVFYPGEHVSPSNQKNLGCWAGVNMLGICSREPCEGHPGGYFKPYPLNLSRIPSPIYTRDSPYSNPFKNPYKDVNLSAVYDERDAYVEELKMIDLRSGTVLDKEFYRTVTVENGTEIAFKAFTKGPVQYIDFFLNGGLIRRERHKPYLMFGDRDGKTLFWKTPILEKWVKLTLVVTGQNKRSTSTIYWFRLVLKQ